MEEAYRPMTNEEANMCERILALCVGVDETTSATITRNHLLRYDADYVNDDRLAYFHCEQSFGILEHSRSPLSAFYDDADGCEISLLLFIEHGRMKELEVIRGDGRKIQEFPPRSPIYDD